MQDLGFVLQMKCVCVFVCICVCLCVCECVCACVCAGCKMPDLSSVLQHTHCVVRHTDEMCVCVRVCVCVCVFVCVRVCGCVCRIQDAEP